MKIRFKQIISYILGAILVMGGAVIAGSLTPSANTSTPNFVTLSDLYNKVINNTFSTSTHSISTTTVAASSMYSLLDVYNAIPTLDASNIATGTTYMGVVGTLVDSALTWSSSDYPNNGSPILTGWNTGSLFCANATNGGYNDWRLPTVGELRLKFEETDSAPVDFSDGIYWSRSMGPGGSDFFYSMQTFDGFINTSDIRDTSAFVRCVR